MASSRRHRKEPHKRHARPAGQRTSLISSQGKYTSHFWNSKTTTRAKQGNENPAALRALSLSPISPTRHLSPLLHSFLSAPPPLSLSLSVISTCARTHHHRHISILYAARPSSSLHPHFGLTRPEYCSKHKLPGMFNVKGRRCVHPEW